jgi:hypothetical protein
MVGSRRDRPFSPTATSNESKTSLKLMPRCWRTTGVALPHADARKQQKSEDVEHKILEHEQNIKAHGLACASGTLRSPEQQSDTRRHVVGTLFMLQQYNSN